MAFVDELRVSAAAYGYVFLKSSRVPNVAFPAAPVASLPEYIPHKTRHSIYRLKLTPIKVILDVFLSVITGSMSQAALTAVWCKWLQVRRYGGCETIMLSCDHNVLYPFRYVVLGLLVLILERDLPVPKSIVQIRSVLSPPAKVPLAL